MLHLNVLLVSKVQFTSADVGWKYAKLTTNYANTSLIPSLRMYFKHRQPIFTVFPNAKPKQ